MREARAVSALFTAAIFLAAALLFVVQPMVGKMVLPRAGGSPQVWNTSLLFFQAALLGGYLYAHLSVRWLGVRRQAVLHLVVLALPLLVLPIALPDGYPPSGGSPAPWILGVLSLAVGAPFLVLSAASPLIQRWLAETEHADADDPYFLYAGSNAGSLVGLLAYPFVLEPLVPVSQQSRLWAAGYVGFMGLAVLCAAVAVFSARASHPVYAREESRDTGDVTARDRLFWVASAAVPSALLLGVTQYLTSQIAPVSLLWVLPLAVYLCTFIAAFARRRIASVQRVSRVLAMVTVAAALVMLARIVDPAWAITILHLGVLATAGLLCHMRLADSRPATSHLTEYYLLISTGGALGGTVAALAAPLLFDSIAEYPIALALACLFRLPQKRPAEDRGLLRLLFTGRRLDVLLPLALAAYVLLVVSVSRTVGLADGWTVVLAAVLPTLVVFAFSPRPVRFALGLGVLLASAESGQIYRGDRLYTERTFFGVHRVVRDPGESVTILYHGSTVHGVQSLDPARATEPLAYYHPTGPAGTVLGAIAGQEDKSSIALVGAGTGALAVLAGGHQHVTLYEIDPEVVWIAEESGYFTYLANARASYETVVGDGRVALSRSGDVYDLMVLDAFSSGTIPLHLLTREAMELYLRRLATGGALLFHISNRHLELAPVLGAHARDLELVAFEWIDARDDDTVEGGIFGSHWVLIARSPQEIAYLPVAGWRPLSGPPSERAWTDDFSDLLSVQRWN